MSGFRKSDHNYVVLTSHLLKSQSLIFYIAKKLCIFDFKNAKITIYNILFQIYYCYNYNKYYVFLTLRILKVQYTICYFNYTTVIIKTKIM